MLPTCASSGSGSPGPLERNTPSGFSASTSSAEVSGRHHRDAAAHLHQAAQDVALDAEIVGHHVKAGLGRRRERFRRASTAPRAWSTRRASAVETRLARSRPAMVGMERAFSTSLPQSLLDRREHSAHHAARAQMADQGARVQVGDHRDAGLLEEAVGLVVGAPVAGDGGKLAHHQAFDIRPDRFVVFRAGAVVADLRIGEDHDLAGIGGVGEYFLVSGERGVEDDLAGPLGGRTKTPALEDRAVFQGEDCRVQFRLFLPGSG